MQDETCLQLHLKIYLYIYHTAFISISSHYNRGAIPSSYQNLALSPVFGFSFPPASQKTYTIITCILKLLFSFNSQTVSAGSHSQKQNKTVSTSTISSVYFYLPKRVLNTWCSHSHLYLQHYLASHSITPTNSSHKGHH